MYFEYEINEFLILLRKKEPRASPSGALPGVFMVLV